MDRPKIVMRYGAAHDDIIVDGVTFVRHELTRKQRLFLRNVVVDTLASVGAVTRKPMLRRAKEARA
ncbi:hypothetical protein [Aquibium microcysteis]|uniref:hypothetical protein n=1 Tax=Aquibium microcysteis TaxID=675281 RepID=UPI00165D1270|nr:hypothetical protein [Aquibium microcysteis]